MSQMDEHNSTHTLLSAQMKNLNVSWLLSLVVLFRLNFVQHVSRFVEISQFSIAFLVGVILHYLKNWFLFFSQDDLRRANRDLNKGKDEMKNLTSKIGKRYITV